jgi:hypothetical protein
MKKIYSVYIVSLLALAASAKTTSISVPDIYPHFNLQAIVTSPDAPHIRIIGQTYLTYNGSAFEAVDSTTYSYSGGRGGLLTPDELSDKYTNFDESIIYAFNASSGNYSSELMRRQTFDANNNSVLYSYFDWKVQGVPVPYWKDSWRYHYDYNSANMIESCIRQRWIDGGIWEDHVVYENIYDANDNVSEMNANGYTILFSYNVDNKIIQRTDNVSAGWGGPWLSNHRVNFTYDSNGRLDNYVIQIWNGGWVDSVKLSYTYNASDIVAATESLWLNNTWTNSGINNFTYDVNHNRLSDVRLNWDAGQGAYVNAYRTLYTFNSNNQPTKVITSTWDAGGSSWQFTTDDYQLRYYYEAYSPTDVHEVEASKLDMAIYPIPAQNEVNVDMKWETAQPYTISIFDVQGKLWKNFMEPATTTAHKNIGVNDLPSGNYFIKISGKEGQRTQKFTVFH